MKQLLSAYQKSALDSKVMGASPHGLVTMLLEKLCEQLDIANRTFMCMQQVSQDLQASERTELITTAAMSLQHAMKISQSLEESLESKHDEELASQLRGLYQHIQHYILLATEHQESCYSEQALKVAKDILVIWESIPSEFHYVAQ